MRLDQTSAKKDPEEDAPVDGKGIVLDRNSLIAQIMSQSKKP
jgi:hypothetical protein